MLTFAHMYSDLLDVVRTSKCTFGWKLQSNLDINMDSEVNYPFTSNAKYRNLSLKMLVSHCLLLSVYK